jgi:hypothetical protein|nr:MAG TPA: hypothetical protein [Caudoviricetes sp.]DAU26383.1 MAG TPA: hypothetical protein [Caudoviricetes sp.]
MRRIDELVAMHEYSLDYFESKGDVSDYWKNYFAKEIAVLRAVDGAVRYQRNVNR